MTNIEIENAELIMPFRNFSGKSSKFNKEGDRNFAVYIPEDMAAQLADDGWNVKRTNPRNEDDEARPYLNIAVKFGYRPPEILVGTSPRAMKRMDEDTVGELDWADIASVDLTIRPRAYDVNGKTGIKAYLGEMYVIINKSSFAERYSSETAEDLLF